MWPSGFPDRKGKIAPDRQLRIGRALGLEGQAPPGDPVDAAVALVRTWDPDPAPTWITWVPSASAPGDAAELAGRLGGALGLEVHDVLCRTRPGRPQREMANSAQQLANVLDAFGVAGPVPSGPVLLLDDTVDSRWTLTVVGTLLLDAGSGPVHPLALAQSSGD